MYYSDTNFKTKKAMKDAVKEGKQARDRLPG